MSCGEDRIRLTAEGRLCDAEEEAREKYRAWEPRVFPLTYREGCGLVELERMTVGVSTKDGEKYSYWYVRRDYETGGKCADRYEALTLVGDELAGCSCRGIVNALCPVHGDFRDTSVDLWREERDHLDALLGVLEVGL